MSLLDLLGITRIYKDGVEALTRKGLDFVGAAVTVEDDPINGRTKITISTGTAGATTGPGSSTAGHLVTWADAAGLELADGGLDVASLLARLEPCVYRGGLGGSAPNVSYTVSNTWTGLISAIAGGTWSDDVSANITRSGESFTVAKAGWYHVDVAAPAFVSGAPPLWGLRVRVNGTVKLSQISFAGTASSAGNNGYVSGNVLCAEGDVITFQYCAANGTPSFFLTAGQVGGANPNVLSVNIIRVLGV